MIMIWEFDDAMWTHSVLQAKGFFRILTKFHEKQISVVHESRSLSPHLSGHRFKTQTLIVAILTILKNGSRASWKAISLIVSFTMVYVCWFWVCRSKKVKKLKKGRWSIELRGPVPQHHIIGDPGNGKKRLLSQHGDNQEEGKIDVVVEPKRKQRKKMNNQSCILICQHCHYNLCLYFRLSAILITLTLPFFKKKSGSVGLR